MSNVKQNANEKVKQRAFTLELCQENLLAGQHYHREEPHKGVVILAPAMGVNQTFYSAFACWLASHGYDVLTFDYRGTGQSRQQASKSVQLSVTDWVNEDCVAIIDKAEHLAEGKPIYWIGHSLGGQIFGMIPNKDKVSQVITVASGSGYWRNFGVKVRSMSFWLWFVAVPIATRLFGYFPGKKMGKVGDLPKAVINQWRRWCLDPEYLVGAEGTTVKERFLTSEVPVTALAFKDDELINYASVDKLHNFYQMAEKVQHYICPKQQSLPRIGHFGFFKSLPENPLWHVYILPVLRSVGD